jgi:hypothetical protein
MYAIYIAPVDQVEATQIRHGLNRLLADLDARRDALKSAIEDLSRACEDFTVAIEEPATIAAELAVSAGELAKRAAPLAEEIKKALTDAAKPRRTRRAAGRPARSAQGSKLEEARAALTSLRDDGTLRRGELADRSFTMRWLRSAAARRGWTPTGQPAAQGKLIRGVLRELVPGLNEPGRGPGKRYQVPDDDCDDDTDGDAEASSDPPPPAPEADNDCDGAEEADVERSPAPPTTTATTPTPTTTTTTTECNGGDGCDVPQCEICRPAPWTPPTPTGPTAEEIDQATGKKIPKVVLTSASREICRVWLPPARFRSIAKGWTAMPESDAVLAASLEEAAASRQWMETRRTPAFGVRFTLPQSD